MMCWSDCSLHFTQSSVDSESVAKMWLKTEETCQTDGQFFAHCSAPGMQANHRRRFESHAAGWNPKQAKRLEWGCPCRVGLWRLQNGNPNLWTCTCDTCAFVVICCRHLLSFVVICCHLCTLSTFSNYIHEWQYMASWCHLQYCGWLGASWYLWWAKTLGCISDWLPQLPSAGAPFEDFALFLLHLYFGSQSSQSLDSFG